MAVYDANLRPKKELIDQLINHTPHGQSLTPEWFKLLSKTIGIKAYSCEKPGPREIRADTRKKKFQYQCNGACCARLLVSGLGATDVIVTFNDCVGRVFSYKVNIDPDEPDEAPEHVERVGTSVNALKPSSANHLILKGNQAHHAIVSCWRESPGLIYMEAKQHTDYSSELRGGTWVPAENSPRPTEVPPDNLKWSAREDLMCITYIPKDAILPFISYLDHYLRMSDAEFESSAFKSNLSNGLAVGSILFTLLTEAVSISSLISIPVGICMTLLPYALDSNYHDGILNLIKRIHDNVPTESGDPGTWIPASGIRIRTKRIKEGQESGPSGKYRLRVSFSHEVSLWDPNHGMRGEPGWLGNWYLDDYSKLSEKVSGK